ncbi:MAG: DUF1972 domain-containing protein [Bacteroidota bacterium]
MSSNKKKVAIIGTVGLPANYGGFETLTDHLVQYLGDQYEMTVYCSRQKYPRKKRPTTYSHARLKYMPFAANGFQSILYDALSILHAIFFADVLLILGVSGAWILPLVRLLTRKRIIISIDGIEWKRNKWKLFAKWYLWWAEKIAVRYSHIDISDNESIQDYTAARYGSLSRIIEYGGDHARLSEPTDMDKRCFPFLAFPYAIKVCRIEPENNVKTILEAFSHMPKRTLVVIGNWDNSSYGKRLKAQYADFQNIILLNPIYDQRLLNVLRGHALVYIHGHTAGGTNPSLVEAMHLGLPIITQGVSYNRTTTEGKALYFQSISELKTLVENLSIAQLKVIGKSMKDIAQRRYRWELIINKYDQLIHEAIYMTKKKQVLPALSQMSDQFLAEHEASHLKYQYLFFEKR